MPKTIKYKPQPITTYFEPLACYTCNAETDAGEAIGVKILSYDGFRVKPTYMYVCPVCYYTASSKAYLRNKEKEEV